MPEPKDEQELEHSKMSFADHLEELRTALWKSILALAVGSIVGFSVGGSVVDYIQTPLRQQLELHFGRLAVQTQVDRLEEMQAAGMTVPEDLEAAAQKIVDDGLVPKDIYLDRAELQRALGEKESETLAAKDPGLLSEDLVLLRAYEPLSADSRLNLVGLSAQEPFFVYVKAAVVVGAVVSSPFIFFYIWEFIAAGLYRHERKQIYLYLPISLGLFFAGAALAFYGALSFVLTFLFWFNEQMGIVPTLRISDWISFVLMLPLGFGISFQLPLVMLFLERIGIFTVADYKKKWRIAVLVISIISMLLTPADPWSMMLMGIPLVALYFGGIMLCKHMPRSKTKPIEGMPEETSGS